MSCTALGGTSTTQAPPTKPGAPLIVVMGGYDSCVLNEDGIPSPFGSGFGVRGVRMVNELSATMSQVEYAEAHMNGRGIRWLFSCFDDDSHLYYQTSDDSYVMDGAGWTFGDLATLIGKLSDNYLRSIFVVGHSHGGWLGMGVVESLPKPIKHGFLTTIDPISFALCNADTYYEALTTAIIGNPIGGWKRIGPCQQAPGDYAIDDLQLIRENLGSNSWKTYYQTVFKPLHSGAFPFGPTVTIDMSPMFDLLSGQIFSGTIPHIGISTHPSIWSGLKASIVSTYGAAE